MKNTKAPVTVHFAIPQSRNSKGEWKTACGLRVKVDNTRMTGTARYVTCKRCKKVGF